MSGDATTTTGQEALAEPGHEAEELLLKAARPVSRQAVRAVAVVAALVAGCAVQVGWRLWLARAVPTPIAHADEDRYLIIARALAGGPGGLGNDTTVFRRLGYPLLLAPIYHYASDPFKVYRYAQDIGAVINALTFPLAYGFARRVFGMSRRLALGMGFVIATLPAVVYYGEFAMTDAIFPPIGLAWLLLLHTWLAGKSRWVRGPAAIGAAAVAGYAYVIHVRGLVLLVIHLGVVSFVLLTRRARWVVSTASAAVAIGLTQVNTFAEDLVRKRMEYGGVEPASQMWSQITSARGLAHTLADAAGQIWYAGVSTWGLAAVGLVVAVRQILNRDTTRVPPTPGLAGGRHTARTGEDETDWPRRVVLGVALAATVLIALSSVTALPQDGRQSNHAYPRYTAFLMPVWAIVGAYTLLRADRRRAWRLTAFATALVGVTGFLVLSRMSELVHEWFESFDTPEVSFLSANWKRLSVGRGSAVALALLAAFVLAVGSRRMRKVLTPMALAGVLAVNIGAMVVINDKSVHPRSVKEYATAPKLVADLHLNPSDVVVSSNRIGLGPKLNHQREVYWASVPDFNDLKSKPPGNATVVIAPWNLPRRKGVKTNGDWDGTKLGWRRVAGDPVVQWAVWFRDTDPRLQAPISTGNGR